MTASTLEADTSVRLSGRPDPNPSRWLWLVKMFLAVPHYIVLAFLWIAFLVVTVVAGCQVLVTGCYPRALFDFNLGVLRWNWRLGFYVYAALGTDRYPPFTLARVADYPATLDLPYPEQLPHGLTLVRSWLAAAPHLVIVFLIAGVLLPYPWTDVRAWTPGFEPIGCYSILNVLVVVAGSFLLITGHYPQTLFDLLMGINRWLYRVLTYTTFMATAYPPFRLDQGASEPDTSNRPQMNNTRAAAAREIATRTRARI